MKRKIFVIFAYLLFIHCLLLSTCFCGELNIGLGWPYIALKYNFSKRIASEIKWATGEGINVYAGRGYWNFRTFDRLKLFTGLEAGYIAFDTLDIKGTGYETSIFLGGEYFILPQKLSFAVDISPTFIGLRSDEYKIDGFEWVVNLAVYYYFSSKNNVVFV
jgi:hypothetical protein